MSAPGSQKIILGSRGSELARRQTAMVAAALRQAWPDLEVVTQIISTRGDVRTAEPIDPRAGRKGLFTGEIERALIAGEIDVAVHSAKDLPSEMTPELELGAVLPRAPVEDVLITKQLKTSGAIATGSVRRQHQLRWKFPGVEIVELRGNVPTRLRKFLQSDWQAIVLARAGLERLGYDLARGAFEFESVSLRAETLSADVFLPAGGQGIIALQVRGDDRDRRNVTREINHAETLLCLEAEREFLRLLQGDCGSPVGVLAAISGASMTVRAQVFDPPRVEPRTARVEGEASAPKKLARELWEAING
ncbi:MAG: hydroxymethylbilane synthase [Verrucomicrobia bacterium]|nr:MAG: hydroxymethylbilane synthase [Verrucomicrobiota bacterium]